MAGRVEPAAAAQRTGGAPSVVGWITRAPRVTLALLFAIWVVLPLVPAETGLQFGLGFRLYFTGVLLVSALFFWFLRQERIPAPSSGLGVLASVAGVYVATVGLLVAVAAASPQFELPRPAEEASVLEAARRGEALFSKAEVGCFLCHTIAGRGGTRGPELTHVAARAGDRVPGLSAERYLLEKVKAGASYQFKVPEYVPIMPAFGATLSEEQVADLVAYLVTLR